MRLGCLYDHIPVSSQKITPSQGRYVAEHRQSLVDLLLVLPNEVNRFAVVEQIFNLADCQVRVERDDLAADREHGKLHPKILGLIFPDDRDRLAA